MFDAIVLTNGGRLEVVAGQTLDVSAGANVIKGGGGTLQNNGTVKAPSSFTITNWTLEHNPGATLSGVRDLTVAKGGVLTHTINQTNEQYRLDLIVRNLTIEPGGKVQAYGRGYDEAYGPGTPQPQFGYYSLYQGASYGGRGNGVATSPPFFPSQLPYGSATAPTNLGSGGTRWDPVNSKRGGGAIKLTVQKTLLLDGEINADGVGDPAFYGSAASGGSIWLDVRRLDGNGTIHANGGVDTSTGWYAGGGGGRIAIGYARSGSFALPALGLYTNRETISSNVTVKGGYPIPLVVSDGPEDGSIYIYQAVRPAEGSLFILY